MLLAQHKQQKNADYIVFVISLCTSFFLLLLYLNYAIFGIESTAIGVVQELLALPCIVSQPVLLFLSIRSVLRPGYRYKSIAFITLLLSSITLLAVCISFLST